MFRYYYHVYTNHLHIDIVQAYNEEHAIQLIESMYGPATNYNSNDKYKAVRA